MALDLKPVQVRLSEEARLEQHIVEMSRQIEGLMALGKFDAAREAAQKRAALIAARSPEQIARLEAAKDAAE